MSDNLEADVPALVIANPKEPARIHIRWMIRRDMPEVLLIEQGSFGRPWSEEDFLRCLRERNCIGMVAEQGEAVVGFMIYEMVADRLHILNFAVHPEHRRRGVGKQMAAKLVSKLSSLRRSAIAVEVCETNLPAQLFFRALGFRAITVPKDNPDFGGQTIFMKFALPSYAAFDPDPPVIG